MVSAMQQLVTSIGLVEVLEEETSRPCRFSDSLLWQSYREYQPKLVRDSLWIHGCFIHSTVHTDMSKGEFALPLSVGVVEPCAQCETALHYKAHIESPAFVALLRDCAKTQDLGRGSQLHDDITKLGLTDRCSDALISMYVKCGAIEKAKALLETYRSKNVSSWTALIAGFTRQGKGRDAIDCFERMQHEGITPDSVTFACLLRACGSIKAVEKGSLIHEQIASQGLLRSDTLLGNALVDMYAKCGELAKAQHALDELPCRDVVSWNTLLTGYAQHGQGEQALKCFEMMKRERMSPNEVTYSCALKACSIVKARDRGEQIHDEIARQGLLKCSPVLGAALVDMYAKCGTLGKAQRVLEEVSLHDVVLWNSLIGGYAKQGRGTEALKCFKSMQHKGISPNAITFTCILKACGTTGAINIGKQIHDNIVKEGLLKNNVVLGTALVDMYAKCGALAKAQEVLEELPSRSVVSWSALIAGYAHHGQGDQALSCFDQMQHEGISPDRVMFICILKACGSIKAIDKGNHIYDQIVRLGLLKSDVMLGTAVVDMYVKCCALPKARQVLEALPFRNVVSWNTLIAGYAQQSQGEEALDCFELMQCEGICPDAVTFACLLKVCGILNALEKGELIHDEIVRQRMLENDIVLGTAVVDMYVKCGALVKARKALEMLPSRNVVSWNALIAGYAQQGQAEEALCSFKQMQLEGIAPDAVTFSSVLSSCSHLGLVEDGYAYFTSMSSKYGLKPQLEHYSCMVDLYGRAGHLDKAARVIQDMPCTDDSSILSALLGACQKWGDVKVGRWAFQEAVRVDKSEGGAYVLMANLHAAAGLPADAGKMEAVTLEI